MSNEKEGLGATLNVPVSKTTFTTKSGASFTINYYSIGDVRKVFREEFPVSNCSINFERNANGDLVLIGVLSYNYQKDSLSLIHTNEIQLTMLVPQTINDTKEGNVLITFMEKRLKVMALGLPDPEEQIEEEKSYSNTKSDTKEEDNKEPDILQKARNGIWIILKKAGVDNDDDRHTILNKMVGNFHINAFTQKEINEFYKQIGDMIGAEKIQVSKLTDEDFKIIKSYFDDFLGGENEDNSN